MTHARRLLAGLAVPGLIPAPAGSRCAEPALEVPGVAEVLGAGRLAYVAVGTRRGPFVTPVLYGVSGGRLWLLTRRGTLKARLLHARPQAGLLVRDGDRAVAMQGEVRLLEPARPRGLTEAASETAAAPWGMLSWVARNRREVFGFTVDAPRILAQLAPQNVVLVAFRPQRVALTRGRTIEASWGAWPAPVVGASAGTGAPEVTPAVSDLRVLAEPLPPGLASLPTRPGEAVAGLAAPGGPLALPADWDPVSGLAHLPAGLIATAGTAGVALPVSLTFDEPGHTRPTEQRGVMLRGTGHLVATEDTPPVLAVDADRVTFWTGFTTGTVDRRTDEPRRAVS